MFAWLVDGMTYMPKLLIHLFGRLMNAMQHMCMPCNTCVCPAESWRRGRVGTNSVVPYKAMANYDSLPNINICRRLKLKIAVTPPGLALQHSLIFIIVVGPKGIKLFFSVQNCGSFHITWQVYVPDPPCRDISDQGRKEMPTRKIQVDNHQVA